MSLIISWLILSLAVWVTAAVLPGFHVKDLNFFLGWLLFVVFTVATLGLAWLLAFITRWIINALLLMLTDRLTDRLKIASFGWALGGALLISVVAALVQFVLPGI